MIVPPGIEMGYVYPTPGNPPVHNPTVAMDALVCPELTLWTIILYREYATGLATATIVSALVDHGRLAVCVYTWVHETPSELPANVHDTGAASTVSGRKTMWETAVACSNTRSKVSPWIPWPLTVVLTDPLYTPSSYTACVVHAVAISESNT
jgi:hypothetical protein